MGEWGRGDQWGSGGGVISGGVGGMGEQWGSGGGVISGGVGEG